MSQPSASMPQQVKSQLEAKLPLNSSQDQSSQTSTFSPKFSVKERLPSSSNMNNSMHTEHDFAETISEGGFSPVNPLQKFEFKPSPVTFVSPSTQVKMKRIKKTSNAGKGSNIIEDQANSEGPLSKNVTNKVERENYELESGSVNAQKRSQVGSANVASISTPSTAETSSETQNMQSHGLPSNASESQNNPNSGLNVNVTNTKSHANSHATGAGGPSSKTSSPRKLSAGSGRFNNFQKNVSGSSESLTGGQGGETGSNQSQGSYYVNRSGGFNRNNKMNSPKKKYSGGSSGGFNRHNEGKFRNNNNRNAPNSQQYNKHANSGAMGHKKKMPSQSHANSSSSVHETALSKKSTIVF